MWILVRAIGWVIVGAFAITFAVTILALIGRLTIAEPYLGSLFGSLIIELLSAGFFLFKAGFLDESSAKQLDQLKGFVAKENGSHPDEVKLDTLVQRLTASPSCKDCGRDYCAIIYWHPDYANKLFNFEGLTPNFQQVNPRSEGHLHYYKTPRGCYKGFSTWETRNGERSYSQVVVIHREFKFDELGRLKEISTNIVVRKKLVEFSYGPFTHYRMRFNEYSETELRGKMLLVQNGNGSEELEVGDIVMELD